MHDKNFKTQSRFGKKSFHFLNVVVFVYEKLGCMLPNLGHNLKIKIRGGHLHITMRICHCTLEIGSGIEARQRSKGRGCF